MEIGAIEKSKKSVSLENKKIEKYYRAQYANY